MEDKKQFVDRLLDSALAHRQKTEPRPGLEVRILENIRTADRQNAQAHWSWAPRTTGWVLVAAVVVVVAAVVYVAYLGRGPAVQTPRASQTVTVQPQNKELAASPEATPKPRRVAPVLKAKQAAQEVGPKPRRTEAHRWPAQFPTPAPLTPEEKALMRYVEETPAQVLATPVLKKEAAIQPVEIEPLKIPPLEIKPLPPAAASMQTQ
ncbi:MAG: hypothetical protein P8Z30_18860 [Acidobacteriota bacterium]